MIEVTGHLAGDADRAAVLSRLTGAVVRDNLVTGRADEAELDDLQQLGLVVHTLGDPAGEAVPALAPVAATGLGSLNLSAVDDAPAAALAGYGQTVVLRTVAMPPPDWRDRLAALGVTVLERVAENGYVARDADGRAGDPAALEFVTAVRPYRLSDTADPGTVVAPGGSPPGALPVRYEALAHRAADLPAIRAWLAAHGCPEDGAGRRKVRFRCPFGDPRLLELARRPDVAAVDLHLDPEPCNDHARQIIGLRPGAGAPAGLSGLTGRGQIVGIADTGVDSTHPDLARRLLKVVARGRPGDASDPHGHGTHVAGTLAGEGCASGGVLRGVAPGAELFFQSVLDAAGRLGGLPVDLHDLLAEAYDAGARIHNDSWGAEAGAVYRMSSLEIDEFVAEHPDLLVVVAAGNAGRAGAPRHVPPGDVDLFSVGAPATAKNALTVGASRSTRRRPDRTWRQWNPVAFPDPPIGDEHVGGDPDSLAAFSSRGPCQEHDRIKPDLVAPGTCVVSARSATAPDSRFWAGWNDDYAVLGGTSMAAPVVAGAAALLREWFTGLGHTPSAALLKATLINGTRWLGGRDATAQHPYPPNCHQGFGRLDLTAVLPTGFADTWAGVGAPLTRLGQTTRLALRRTGTGPLRVCLAWTDPPGRGLQHALSLLVSDRTGRRRWTGNEQRRTGYAVADTANNVQVVRLPAAGPGDWTIEITAASELLFGPQDFAVVVTGLPTDVPAPPWRRP